MSAGDCEPLGPDEGFDLLWSSLAFDAKGGGTVVLAVSGGADSLLLLVLAAENAARIDRRFEIVTVDHGLRRESPDEARRVGEMARRNGLSHRTLEWRRPHAGGNLSAQAREGRYEIVADAARALGATAVMTAHHQDDQIETHLLARERGEGEGRQAAMRPARALAPGLTLLRPFLSLPRARIEASLRLRGLEWIEDPTNRDVRYARARLRLALRSMASAERRDILLRIETLGDARARLEGEVASLLHDAEVDAAGVITAGLEAWAHASLAARAALLSRLATAASGGAAAPAAEPLRRLREKLDVRRPFAATLAGCRLEAGEDRLVAMREYGRKGPASLPLGAAHPPLFDGRFDFAALPGCEGARAVPLGVLGLGNRVTSTLPVVVDPAGVPLAAHPLARGRLGPAVASLACGEVVSWRLRRDLPVRGYRLLDQIAAKAPNPVGNEKAADYLSRG